MSGELDGFVSANSGLQLKPALIKGWDEIDVDYLHRIIDFPQRL